MKTYFITGGAGFIGSTLSEKLLNDGDLRKSLVKNGVEVSARYSWNITIDKIEEYYQEIANYVIE